MPNWDDLNPAGTVFNAMLPRKAEPALPKSVLTDRALFMARRDVWPFPTTYVNCANKSEETGEMLAAVQDALARRGM